MPIEVNVSVNGKPLHTVYVGRTHTKTFDVNKYTVVVKEAVGGTLEKGTHYDPNPPTNEEWDNGATVYHVAGEGVNVLIRKAFEALEN